MASVGSRRPASGRSPALTRRGSWKMAARMTFTLPLRRARWGALPEGYCQGTFAQYGRGTLHPVDPAKEIAEFLASRRAKVTPEQVGLPTYGPRRVKGLRREEVASLAGVSVEYYKRLERGNASGVSELVLEGLARALQLDEAERAHLFDLVRAVGRVGPGPPKRARPVKTKIRPVVQQILDRIDAPATVRNGRLDYVGANAFGRALYAPVWESR